MTGDRIVSLLNKYRSKILYGAWFALFVLTISAASGQVDRWDLLEQVAISDHFRIFGFFYPDSSDPIPPPVSVYFMGNALLALVLQSVGIQTYLVETLLLLACLICMFFLVLQVKLAQALNDQICVDKGSYIAISICVLVAPFWWFYAREFKPDTIAYTLGSLGLIYTKFFKHQIGWLRLAIAALICALGLFFKQQYIIYLAGLAVYCFAFHTRERLLFLSFLLFFMALIISLLLSNPFAYFWTIEVLSDDGFLSLSQIFKDNFGTIVNAVFLFLLACLISQRKGSSITSREQLLKFFNNPLPWVIIPSAIVAIASAGKVGGNQGNTQLAVVMCLPFIIAFFSKIDKKFLLLCALWGLSSKAYFIYTGPRDYVESLQLKAFVASLPNEGGTVMTGSNVYFASRELYKNSRVQRIYSYWSISLQKGISLNEAFALGLKSSPKFVIVENGGMVSRDAITGGGNYEIIFENENGIVASRIDES